MPDDRARLAQVRADVARLLVVGRSHREIAAELGLSKSAVTRAAQWHATHNPHPPATPTKHIEFAQGTTTGSVVSEAFEPLTIEDAAEKGGLDLDEYEVTGGRMSAYPTTVKHHHDDGTTSAETVNHWAVALQFKPRVIAPGKVWEQVLWDIKRGKPPPIPKPRKASTGNTLLEISTPDLHVGKMGVGGHTLDNAHDRAIDATGYFLNKADRPARILLPIGNDLLHVDTASRTTTKGTPQDCVADPIEIFTAARRLIETQVTMCAQVAPVDVVVVPGNHDRLGAWHLAHVIDARFHGSKRVSVKLEQQRYRVYYPWGKVLLGFAHGSKSDPKPAELGQLMAEESPDWASSRWREWHLGHLHQNILRQINSVILRWIPSLSVTDGWHDDRGYLCPPEAQAFAWDKKHGMDSMFAHRPRKSER